MSKTDRIATIIIALILIFSGLGAAYGGLAIRAGDEIQSQWPQAEGTIIEERIVEEGRNTSGDSAPNSYVQVPRLVYTYSVNGQTYQAEDTAPNISDPTSLERAQEALDAYELNETITVYYNPADPQDSALYAGIGNGWIFILILGVVLILTGVITCVFAFRKTQQA
jgi:hypothetical protein